MCRGEDAGRQAGLRELHNVFRKHENTSPDIPVFSIWLFVSRWGWIAIAGVVSARQMKWKWVGKQRELQVSYCTCCFPKSNCQVIKLTGGLVVWLKSLRSTGFSKLPHDKSNEHFFISSCLRVYWSNPWRNDYIISSVGQCHHEQHRLVTLQSFKCFFQGTDLFLPIRSVIIWGQLIPVWEFWCFLELTSVFEGNMYAMCSVVCSCKKKKKKQ